MKSEKLVFKSSARDFPVSGFTNVKISNDSILAIKSATSKPAQDILNELVEYALDNSLIEKADGTTVFASDVIDMII
jgi:hypothetical protein